MGYIVLTIIFIFILTIIGKKTFRWETIIKYLWKQIYERANVMAALLNHSDITGDESTIVENFKRQIDFRGNIINSVLDYINYLKKEEDKDAEGETFGYGRYDFNTILMLARSNPDSFKKIK